jgi:hypothetical protein
MAAPDDRISHGLWRPVRAKVYARAGRRAEAESLAREAVMLFAETDMVDYQAHARADLSEVLAMASEEEAAAGELARAVELFEAKGNVVAASRARAALMEIPASGR